MAGSPEDDRKSRTQDSTTSVSDQSFRSPTVIEGFSDYSVLAEKWHELEGLTVCQVTFYSLPSSEIAAKVVRNAVEELVEENSNREILAMAFDILGDTLPSDYYKGPLAYRPEYERIERLEK